MQNVCNGNSPLQVKSEQEALLIACEMERRAIRVYERGLTICKDPELKGLIAKFHGEEAEHLKRFSRMGSVSLEMSDLEQQLLLSSYAAQVLFPGGLMQAYREGAFQSVLSLVQFARDSEETAVRVYREFASAVEDTAVRDMFETIAQEEQMHLKTLEEQLEGLCNSQEQNT